MKKLIILLSFSLMLIPSFGQPNSIKRDTLFYTSVSQDTTVFRSFKRELPYVELDVGTLSDNDTICVGYSADKQALIPCSDLFPMKLTKANYKSVVNGTTKYRIGITGNNWNSLWLGVRIKYAGTPGTVKPSLIWTK